VSSNKFLNNWNVQTTLLFVASIWFITYCCITQNVPSVTLFFGWFILIPLTVLRTTWLLALNLGNISAWLLTKKQSGYAELLARWNSSICAWWFNLSRLAGKDAPIVTLRYLRSLTLLATCLTVTEKLDEEIGVRQQVVDLASSSGYYCDAARSCDFLAWRFRKKKDTVHGKHWAERAIGYYERLAKDACACRREHDNLKPKEAALQAWFAKDSFRAGLGAAAEQRAQKAKDLIANCSDVDAELTLIRLMDYFFESNKSNEFEPIANRYLAIKHSEKDPNEMFLVGNALVRLGTIYGATPDKSSQAEAALLSGIEYIKKSGREGMLTKVQPVLDALRNKQS